MDDGCAERASGNLFAVSVAIGIEKIADRGWTLWIVLSEQDFELRQTDPKDVWSILDNYRFEDADANGLDPCAEYLYDQIDRGLGMSIACPKVRKRPLPRWSDIKL